MGQIQGEVASLLGHLVNLQGSWTGQAATAFQAVIAEWRATQQHVEQSMSSIDQGLVLVARQYAEVETNNARLFLH
jgi:WXG100 family type VII secretion target